MHTKMRCVDAIYGKKIGDPMRRSQLLLDNLLACPRITDVDINIDMPRACYDDLTSREPNDGSPMMGKFIKPISQLTSLTHLSLTVPISQGHFSEEFLVQIISKLSYLESFACSNIDVTSAKRIQNADHQTCQSPLGVHLASLTHLTRLALKDARCFDASWNELKWCSSLKEISVIDCHQIKVSVFHAFIKLFAATLVKLEAKNVPCDPSWSIDLDLKDSLGDPLQFELPKLHTLKTSHYLPIEFLRSFHASTNPSNLILDRTPKFEKRDPIRLFADKLIWPNLERLEISHRTIAVPLSQVYYHIPKLGVLCQRRGVEIYVNCEYDYDEDDDDDEQSEEKEEDETDGEDQEQAGYWDL